MFIKGFKEETVVFGPKWVTFSKNGKLQMYDIDYDVITREWIVLNKCSLWDDLKELLKKQYNYTHANNRQLRKHISCFFSGLFGKFSMMLFAGGNAWRIKFSNILQPTIKLKKSDGTYIVKDVVGKHIKLKKG